MLAKRIPSSTGIIRHGPQLRSIRIPRRDSKDGAQQQRRAICPVILAAVAPQKGALVDDVVPRVLPAPVELEEVGLQLVRDGDHLTQLRGGEEALTLHLEGGLARVRGGVARGFADEVVGGLGAEVVQLAVLDHVEAADEAGEVRERTASVIIVVAGAVVLRVMILGGLGGEVTGGRLGA